MIAATFVLSALTWRFVEQPFRYRRRIAFAPMLGSFAAAALAVGAVGLTLHRTSGFYNDWHTLASPFSPTFQGNQNIGFNMRVFDIFGDEPFIDPGRPNVLIVGNSFARGFVNMGDVNGFFGGVEISCSDDVPMCLEAADAASVAARLREVDTLIFGSPSVSADCWETDVAMLEQYVDRVVVIGTKDFG